MRKFEEPNIINLLRNCRRGLKYFLNGCTSSQIQIKELFLIVKKKRKTKSGFILLKTFSKFLRRKNINFSDGPFANQIFELINLRKNKIDIMIGNIRIQNRKRKILYSNSNLKIFNVYECKKIDFYKVRSFA